jgi:hypothetical protein
VKPFCPADFSRIARKDEVHVVLDVHDVHDAMHDYEVVDPIGDEEG